MAPGLRVQFVMVGKVNTQEYQKAGHIVLDARSRV